ESNWGQTPSAAENRKWSLTPICMMLGTCIAGRKTPNDGKLEVDASIADRLAHAGAALHVRVYRSPGILEEGEAAPSRMHCTCNKAKVAGRHVHHFLESELFRRLT